MIANPAILHGWAVATVVAALLTLLCVTETIAHRRGSGRLMESR